MERMHTIYDAAAGKAGPPTRTGTGTARRAAYMAHGRGPTVPGWCSLLLRTGRVALCRWLAWRASARGQRHMAMLVRRGGALVVALWLWEIPCVSLRVVVSDPPARTVRVRWLRSVGLDLSTRPLLAIYDSL
jgi:hypothetical protein